MKRSDCIFCSPDTGQILRQDEHFYIIEDKYPVAPGHLLIISHEHRRDYFELSSEERAGLGAAIHSAKKLIESRFKPDGYNIGINNGAAAGQTIFHFHCHVIPRFAGDSSDPRGGVRHCIPGKGYY